MENNLVELVANAQAGDKDALVRLVMDNKNEYYRLAYVYVRNQEDALDALEDMIVILYENIRKLKKPESFYNWSKTILVNICKKMLKRRKNYVPWDTVREETYDENYEHKVHRSDLAKQLASLNKSQQEAIILRFLLDYDYQTIAEIMKVPLGTVKSRIHTGLAKLRESLGGEYF
ncbi:MAG: RNA polymerase sigma factor [Peptococcaceae bacterium]